MAYGVTTERMMQTRQAVVGAELLRRFEEITGGEGRRFALLEGERFPALAAMVGPVIAVATLQSSGDTPVRHFHPAFNECVPS